MLAVVVASMLVAAPAARADRGSRVLVADLKNDGVDARALPIVRDVVVTELATRAGLDVVSMAETRHLVELDAGAAQVGCDTATASCQSEIAQALGARYVVLGSATSLGDLIAVHLTVTDVDTGATLARAEIEARSLAELPDHVRNGLGPLKDALPGGAALSTAALVAGIGAGLAGVGALSAGIVGAANNGAMNDPSLTPDERKNAENARDLSYVVAGACAVVAAAAGVAWALQ